MKKIGIVSLITIMIYGCGTTLETTTKSSSQLANSRFSNYTSLDFNKGKNMYISYCSGCHPLHKPAEFTEQEWGTILPIMIDLAMLGDNEKELIYRYLITARESASNK